MRVIGAINHYLVPSMLIAIFIWGICFLSTYIRHKKVNIRTWGIRYVFITYLLSIFMITEAYKVFIKGIPAFLIEPNLIPFFCTVTDILTNPYASFVQIGYNFLLFIPFGFLLVISFPDYTWKFWKILLVTIIVVLLVEILEYFSGRYMDIDDIFINVCGSALGYYIYILMSKIIKRMLPF